MFSSPYNVNTLYQTAYAKTQKSNQYWEALKCKGLLNKKNPSEISDRYRSCYTLWAKTQELCGTILADRCVVDLRLPNVELP